MKLYKGQFPISRSYSVENIYYAICHINLLDLYLPSTVYYIDGVLNITIVKYMITCFFKLYLEAQPAHIIINRQHIQQQTFASFIVNLFLTNYCTVSNKGLYKYNYRVATVMTAFCNLSVGVLYTLAKF